ncbi:hypothetical protein PSYMO_37474, partial [Pseudomonas amygdali pv. mori str. 301020]
TVVAAGQAFANESAGLAATPVDKQFLLEIPPAVRRRR